MEFPASSVLNLINNLILPVRFLRVVMNWKQEFYLYQFAARGIWMAPVYQTTEKVIPVVTGEPAGLPLSSLRRAMQR